MVQRTRPKWLESANGNAEELAAKCKTDPDFRGEYLTDVFEWESRKASGKNNSCMPEKVEAYCEDLMELSSVVGYFWPLVLYKKEKKCDPASNGHHVQTVDGRKGVVLDSSHGTPETVAGVERMTKKRNLGVRKVGNLADTEAGCSAEAVAQTHKAAIARVTLKATSACFLSFLLQLACAAFLNLQILCARGEAKS